MARLKGQQPIPRPLRPFTDDHPVARSIRTGDHWFYAWLAQSSTPYVRLAKLTGIPIARFYDISTGGAVSRAEIDALARAWSVSAADLIRSIGGVSPIVE